MDRTKTVGFQVRKLSNFLRRAMDSSAGKQNADNLTGVHGWILGYLYDCELEGKAVYQKNLEYDFNIRRSTVTQIMQLMEKNGLVERKSVLEDARLKRLVLTDKGKEVHLLVVRDIENMEKNVVKGISQQELDAFFNTLNKMKSNITAYIEDMNKDQSAEVIK